MEVRSIAGMDMGSLHQAMNDAYSDYIFPMNISQVEFDAWLAQRGFDPDLSFAAVDGGNVAAFWFIGRKQQVTSSTAYVISVGCRPAYRRGGLARKLLEPVVEGLTVNKCDRLILEVIDGNDKAASLYRSQGFKEVRYLNCFGRLKPLWDEDALPVCVEQVDLEMALQFIKQFGDWEPSWQNSSDAMRNTVSELCSFQALRGDECVATCVISPNGSIYQIAVRPDVRRRSIGTYLLHRVRKTLGVETLHAMNIPSCDKPSVSFFESLNGELICSQYEMQLDLRQSL